MKKLILIGKTGCGKTTLTQVLHDENIDYKKTQAIEYTKNIIDTPGEYIENRALYRALIVSSADCDVIALIQDCSQEESIFPPNFASIFAKPVIGIITKMDLCDDEESYKKATNFLKIAGVSKIFKTSSINKNGINEIKNVLN
ncbi:EutP/PduV family microcompartment system protein [Oceanirhabdus sp. W0125-5]|uniref:EutP/PduV family microcompartment system protein n=1 Tax=Oceanirhabdus sp. W0125-5 TaxID=2999116 RepID=UPI0022F2C716|nr:EutP/PduV family microcompartment system protein [Oceanirhabdus sp. W0125-5]WBW94900.1 EutP/PduV family microcompartment system protein [Oceanirhabdus sp. W0125-5]